VFTDEERKYCFGMAHPHSTRARWAAKEAVSKTFTTGIGGELGWKSISIYHGNAASRWCAWMKRASRCSSGHATHVAVSLRTPNRGHGRGRAGAGG